MQREDNNIRVFQDYWAIIPDAIDTGRASENTPHVMFW
jgi:hypothetical protein